MFNLQLTKLYGIILQKYYNESTYVFIYKGLRNGGNDELFDICGRIFGY